MANKKINKRKATQKKPKEKNYLARFCTVATALILFWWYNNFTLKITETTLKTGKVSSPVRLTVVGDLHLGSAGVGRSKVLSGIKRTNPDIVLILGDMYTCNSTSVTIAEAVDFVASIAEEGYPTYFVPGDHDISTKYLADLSATGVHVMDYKCETLNINGSGIRIMGIDNAYFTPTFDLHNEFYNDPSYFNILMAHIPNFPKYSEFGADLTVCADTHGGMVQLPFIGEAYDPLASTIFPEILGNQPVYDKGWFDYSGGKMFITSGIGCYPSAIRFFNRPEIVTIEICP